MLSQFSGAAERRSLREFLPSSPGFYPAGRLDYDSEGLLLLTNQGELQHRIAHPQLKMKKRYWVQTTSVISDEGLERLQSGLVLKDGPTRPAEAKRIDPPEALWARSEPVAAHRDQLSGWIEIELSEGRNRQVRRMLAAVECPVLRLIRFAIGPWTIDGLAPGEHRLEQVNLPKKPRQPRRRLS